MTLAFWKAAAERAVKTFAQALLALLGTGSIGITSLDWAQLLSVAATAAVASVLTSLASLSTVTPDTGSKTDTAAVEDAKQTSFAATAINPAAPFPPKSFAGTQAKIDAAELAQAAAVEAPADPLADAQATVASLTTPTV